MLNRVSNITTGRAGAAAALLLAGLAVSGCSNGLSVDSYRGGPAANASVHITGSVFGGQQPVSGSTIQLYTVGTTGLKSASRALVSSSVQTDAYGNFSITGAYQCSDGVNPAATQVYITATGGNPGTGSNNSAISMVAALGACSSLNANTFVNINELTTVAAAYALSPFTADIAHVGAAGSNPTGLVNAFANANALVQTSTGVAGGTSLGAGVSVPVAELNTLGDILAACVNSASGASTACSALFNGSGGTDTFTSALGMASNPGAASVTALYSLVGSTVPFQPTLASRPSDFTVAITADAGGNLATPYGIAIDSTGNAWVVNETGSNLVELAPTGGVSANITTLGLAGAQAVAVDRTGNVWVANTAGNSVVKATVSGGSVTGSSSFTTGGINAPIALALDSAGNAWVANFNGNSVTALNNSGTPLSGSPFTGNGGITLPSGVAVSTAGNVYVGNGNGSAVVLTSAGAYSSTLTDNALQGSVTIALDPSSDVILAGFTTGTSTAGAVSEFNAAGAPASVSPVSSASLTPAAVAADGTSLWVTNANTSGGLVKLTYGSASPVSPAAGYGSLSAPQGVAVDSSGSVWTANSGSNTVSKFIGLAVPVTTPLAANVGP